MLKATPKFVYYVGFRTYYRFGYAKKSIDIIAYNVDPMYEALLTQSNIDQVIE